MIKLADERITQLQTELDETKQAKEILDNKLSNYKSQVRLHLIIYFEDFFILFICLRNNIKIEKTNNNFNNNNNNSNNGLCILFLNN